MSQKLCPECGTHNDEAAAMCTLCGHILKERPVAVVAAEPTSLPLPPAPGVAPTVPPQIYTPGAPMPAPAHIFGSAATVDTSAAKVEFLIEGALYALGFFLPWISVSLGALSTSMTGMGVGLAWITVAFLLTLVACASAFVEVPAMFAAISLGRFGLAVAGAGFAIHNAVVIAQVPIFVKVGYGLIIMVLAGLGMCRSSYMLLPIEEKTRGAQVGGGVAVVAVLFILINVHRMHDVMGGGLASLLSGPGANRSFMPTPGSVNPFSPPQSDGGSTSPGG